MKYKQLLLRISKFNYGYYLEFGVLDVGCWMLDVIQFSYGDEKNFSQ
jgi:hypothetical protein